MIKVLRLEETALKLWDHNMRNNSTLNLGKFLVKYVVFSKNYDCSGHCEFLTVSTYVAEFDDPLF